MSEKFIEEISLTSLRVLAFIDLQHCLSEYIYCCREEGGDQRVLTLISAIISHLQHRLGFVYIAVSCSRDVRNYLEPVYRTLEKDMHKPAEV